MIEFKITDDADQLFSAILDGQRVTMRLRYNKFLDRWSLDLSIDDLPVLLGRRIVMGTDLLGAFDFGVGAVFAAPVVAGSVPDRRGLPDGLVRLYQASEDEFKSAFDELAAELAAQIPESGGPVSPGNGGGNNGGGNNQIELVDDDGDGLQDDNSDTLIEA